MVRGALLPHFAATTVTGSSFNYATVWQQRNLLLIVLPPSTEAEAYTASVSAVDDDLCALHTECVVARESVHDLAAPAILIADKWGEIVHIAEPRTVEALPTMPELLEWLDYVERRCPECEGESR